MLSSALSWSNRLTSWKLRAIPASMRPCTDSWVTSRSRNRICPRSGGNRPLIRFTSVVLPAPFEPISASTSRCLTVKFTWSTAWVSPKYLTSSLVTRRPPSASLLPARGEPLRGPDDPGGQRDHERHQHGPEEELPVHRVPDGVGLEVVEHDRADDGARERPEAAEHGHEHALAREGPVHDGGRREAVQRQHEAVGAGGYPEELERERPEHLRERERQDAEEDARVPYTHEPEHRGDDDRADDRPEKEQLHRADPEVLDHQRDDVGAHPEIRGMAEREEPRVSEKQVEAERPDRHDQPVREQDRRVLRDDPRHDEQDHGDRQGPAEDATERSGLARDRGRRDGRRTHGRPKSPAGRTSSTIAAAR